MDMTVYIDTTLSFEADLTFYFIGFEARQYTQKFLRILDYLKGQ